MLRKLNFIKLISLLVVVSFNYSFSEDVFFVVNKYLGSQFYCITNSSRALSWIIEDTSSSIDLQQGSRFLPIAKTLWKVDCNEIQKYGGQCRQSVADEIITDRRWENITITKTDYVNVSSKNKLKFSKILEIESANFNVPLSIRTNQEAHIFLCEDETVTSNCYWFILQGFNGNKTVLRKCPNNTIPTENNVAVKSPCNITKISKEHKSESSKFLTNTTWQHFMLKKNNNKISLSKQDGQEIIPYTDNEETYKIRNILIHSKRNVGLWKIHKDKYFTINQTKRTDFERTLYPVNGKICITTFVRMCKNCKIKFVITSGNNDKQVLGQQIYEKMPKWTEITFVKRATEAKSVKFAIITTGEITSHSYWDIQEIQQCGENGLRMIQLDMMPNCQLLNSDNKVISLDNAVTPSYADKYTKCAENTVSTHCVPCNLFLNGDCGQLKVCENNQYGLLCSCSAGYKTDHGNINCRTNCGNKTYGYHCSKTCSTHCVYCNPVDGTCRRCRDSYRGPKCTMARTPFFKNPPKTQTEYTKAEILVDNFELEDTLDNAGSQYEYTVQYKEVNSRKWTLHTDSASAGMPHTFKIEHLKPDIKYYVRSIIKKNVANYSDSIPKTEFVTKCDVMKSEDLEVDATNTTAYLTVKKDKQFKICKWKSSETEIDIHPNISTFSYQLEDMNLDISGLSPFENFTLTIQNNNTAVKIQFRTKEGVPDKVTNVIARATSDSKIDVMWKAPPKLYGTFQDFVVSYKIIKYLTCDAAPTHLEELKNISTDPSITLSNLNPYTLYSISVKARNTKLSGLEEKVEQNTPQQATIRDEEIPKVSLKKTYSRSVEIEFSDVPCSTLGGPLGVVTTAICLTDWCKDQNVSNSFIYSQHKTFTLSSLFPFTYFQLTFRFHRNSFSKNITFRSFKTKSEAPYAVNNLSLYSKNTHSISVRWRPPSPPTGILKLYQIKLLGHVENINVTNSPCFLWPEYQCYTLENLLENMTYSVQLSAKNEEPDNFGQTSLVKAITKIEPSEKPPDVMVKWTVENDLDIRWKHPVVANGDIQSFEIRIVPQLSFYHGMFVTSFDITKDQYKPTYQKIVKSKNIRSLTNYKIVVEAFNGMDGEEGYVTDVSPPEIPVLKTDPKLIDVSHTTITLQVGKSTNINIANIYKLFLLVTNDKLQSDSYPPELQNFENNFNISLSPFRVIYECKGLSTIKQFVIGKSGKVTNCKQGSNIPLTSGTSYNVTVVLVSTYRGKSSYKLYTKSAHTSWDLRLLVLLLLLLVPIVYTYRLYKKKILAASGQDVGNRNLTSSVELRLNVAGLDHLQSKPITNRKFNNYVKTNLENKKLAAQHNAILQNTAAEYEEIGEKTYLERIDLDFTTGHRIPEVYAICDVPKDFDSFWKLVWNENIEHIVLLDDVHWHQIRKNYWPKFGLSLDIKHILVECIHEEIFTDHEYRTFRLTYQDKIRVIDQLRFTAWMDFDLPHSLTFVNFFKKMSVMSLNKKSPILVHCSTTPKGAGFAVLCDMCLRISKKDNVVDVFKNSKILRDSNFNLIDSYKCYQLAHLVILECLLFSELDVEVDLRDDKSEPSVLYEKERKKYLTYMKDTAWLDQLTSDKNRESNIYFRVDAPSYENELLLRPYSPDEEINSFLSSFDGVIIDDCSCPKKYILLKHPQQDNLEQFWAMVSKMDVSVIINLNENDCFGANRLLKQSGLQVSKTLVLKLVNVTHFKCYDWITVRVLIDEQKHSKDVKIFWMKNWFGEDVCPPSVQDFVEFCIETTSVMADCNSVLITCCDGTTASGLYVAMSYNIENFKKENKSVISTSARLVRRYRHQFGTKDEQLKFLWEATEYFVQQFKLYETL